MKRSHSGSEGVAPHVGIVGGGQLGRMMVLAGLPIGWRFSILDPDESCPCSQLGVRLIHASFHDVEAIKELGRSVDVLTFEIEHISVEALAQLEAEGVAVRPSAETLSAVQDKYLQRTILAEAGLPGPRYAAVSSDDSDAISAFGYPCVQKLRRGGYDGRGVALLHGPESERLSGESLLEERVDIAAELAVLCARGVDGSCRSYEVCELLFDADANICTRVIAPARISQRLSAEARRIGEAAAAAISCVGLCATELFLDRNGRLLVNELAPRPHNSGHWTIEAAETSQFEQHLRAVSAFPLGTTRSRSAAITDNLLARQGSSGRARVRGLSEALGVDAAHVHLYGKAEARSLRKMGHVTVTAATPEEAMASEKQLAITIEGTDMDPANNEGAGRD